MRHGERQEGCDLSVHPAGTQPGVVVEESSHGLGRRRLYCSIGMDILKPATDSFTVQG